jgi:bifunctional non-homologous end joining protein LigD
MYTVTPMEPILSKKIMKGNDWVHQIKWDGIRGLSYIDNGKIKVFSKRGNEITDIYPELETLKKIFKGTQIILDGELVVFDETQKPSFEKILIRNSVKNVKKINRYTNKYPISYILFDLVSLNNKDLREVPLIERYRMLKDSISNIDNIYVTDNFTDGEELFELMKKKNFEGIVSKKSKSPYSILKNHTDWYKTKISKKILAVICGIKIKDKSIKSLLLGIYKEDNLKYIGNVSIGLNESDKSLLIDNINNLKVSIPLYNIGEMKDVVWIKPLITCFVKYLDKTESGSLRHPVLLGFSNKSPKEANGKEYIE